MIDTGAEISLLKVSYLDDDAIVYPNQKICIKGITSESLETLGVCPSVLELTDVHHIKQNFQIVSHNFPIPCAGILGKDFLSSYGCKIDFSTSTIQIGNNQNLSGDDHISLNIKSNHIIPARSEITLPIKVNYDNNLEFLCPSQMIKSDVYVANSLVKVYSFKYY